MNYSEKIIKAYDKWMSIIGEEPEHEYDDRALYKKWKGQNRRAADNFERECLKEGLNYVRVSLDLTAHDLKVN